MGERYQTYSRMKDSAQPWMLDVPDHWELRRFRGLFRIKKRIAGKLGYDILSITQRGIKVKDTASGEGQLSMDYSKYQLVYPGEFAMNHMDLLTGFVDLAEQEGVTSPDYRVFSLEHEGSDSGYYLYLLKLCYWEKIFYPLGRGAAQLGRWRLPSEAFNEFVAPVPSAEEQTKIAAFLNHETTKIDTLIDKQRQLIELLKEKRQAVISHAVTKGLNPDAPMKDSGVEWLGEVPEHWAVKNLRHLGACQNGINIGAEYFGTGFPFVSYGDVYKHESLPTVVNGLVQSTDHDRDTYSVEVGDVLFTRTSETIDEIGFSSTCLSSIENASFAGFLIRFRPMRNTLVAGFSRYYFRNTILRAFFVKEMNLVTRASLSQGLLKKLAVTVPPMNEQKKIAGFLDDKSLVFSKLTSDAKHTIALLQERRTALISAAVTGKIDVRNWEKP